MKFNKYLSYKYIYITFSSPLYVHAVLVFSTVYSTALTKMIAYSILTGKAPLELIENDDLDT